MSRISRKDWARAAKNDVRRNVNATGFLIDVLEGQLEREPGAQAYGPTAYTNDNWDEELDMEEYMDKLRRKGVVVHRKVKEAVATTGGASAHCSIFGAYAEGPSASAGAGQTVVSGMLNYVEVKAEAEASLCKAGVKAGPAVVEFNPNLNTGIAGGTSGFEANILGFGFKVGRSTGINTPFGKISLNF